MQSRFVVARFMEVIYGPWAGSVVTALILWSALASVFALLLGYSRIPYAAALDGYFLKPFAKLHPTGGFPHVSLLVIGGLSVLAGMLELEWVLSALMTVRILVQFVGQVFAVYYVRRYRRDIARPFRMWLYPLPCLIALAGWTYIFVTSGWVFVLYGLLVLASGLVVFLIWRKELL
jgi:amino acid transporter